VPKKQDWPGIIKLVTTSLTGKSKDLLAAVRLVEALTKQDNFVGMRDGFKLLRLLTADCWDRMHPMIEEPDDIETRAGIFEWLCEADSGAWFPTTVSRLPLVKIGSQTASLNDCQTAKLDGKPLDLDLIKNAEPADPAIPELVTQCLEELETLDRAMVEKMAHQSPSLGNLRAALAGCQRYLTRAPSATENSEDSEVASDSTGGASASSVQKPTGAMNRAEAYRQLARLADQLAQMEPHSPIPDLLRWAVKLGELPFRDLIREFVRDPNVLYTIRQQFGIKPPEGEGMS
jgi:type VI secretion system protein ImpA